MNKENFEKMTSYNVLELVKDEFNKLFDYCFQDELNEFDKTTAVNFLTEVRKVCKTVSDNASYPYN